MFTGSIDFRDATTGKVLHSITGLEADVWSVAFSPGSTLASGSTDGIIRLWDATSEQPLKTFVGHVGRQSGVLHSVQMERHSPAGMQTASFACGMSLLDDSSRHSKGIRMMSEALRLARMTAYSSVGVWTAPFVCGTPSPDNPNRRLKGIYRKSGASRLVRMAAYSPVGVWMARFCCGICRRMSHLKLLQQHAYAGLRWRWLPYKALLTFCIFAAQFGLSHGDAGYDARYDLDGDGIIGFGDFLLFANAFGKEGCIEDMRYDLRSSIWQSRSLRSAVSLIQRRMPERVPAVTNKED